MCVCYLKFLALTSSIDIVILLPHPTTQADAVRWLKVGNDQLPSSAQGGEHLELFPGGFSWFSFCPSPKYYHQHKSASLCSINHNVLLSGSDFNFGWNISKSQVRKTCSA